jgi:beta-lactamase regulating signal transducer with metallopeptidase domain
MQSLVHAMLSNAAMATVMAVALIVVARVSRRPALVHSLGLLGLLKLVTPPLFLLPLTVHTSVPTFIESSSQIQTSGNLERGTHRSLATIGRTEASNAEFPSLPPHDVKVTTLIGPGSEAQGRMMRDESVARPRWESIVFSIIFTGAIGFWALAAIRIVRFDYLLRNLEPIPEDWQSRVHELATRLRLKKRPSVELVPGRVPPMLWAVSRRPRLLVPAELWSSIDDARRSALLLHELAHLKRHDHWVRWLELFVCGWYWWLPAAWWLRRGVRAAEEQCCDAWVVWAMPRPDGAKTYAAALLAALEFVSKGSSHVVTAPRAATATIGNGHIPCLKRRLRMIVRARTPKDLSWAGRLAVMAISALLLPLAPSWAQKDVTASALASQPEAESVSVKQEGIFADIDTITRSVDYELALLQEPSKKDAPKPDQNLDIAKRFETQLKDLLDKLGKELTPVGNEVQKSLERAVGEIQKSLKKENLTAEELLKAVQKSRDELRRSFQRGGPVDSEVREALERSRKDAQEAMDRARQEIEHSRDQLHESLRSRVDESKRQGRELDDQIRKDLRELSRKNRSDIDRARGDRKASGEASKPKAEVVERKKVETKREGVVGREPSPDRQDLDEARREIRELQQQLGRATRRLEELQRREPRRGPAARDPLSPRSADASPSAAPASPAKPAVPQVPVVPAVPTRPTELGRGGRPLVPRTPQVPPRADYERRFRDLDSKLERLLEELEKLRKEKADGGNKPADTGSRKSGSSVVETPRFNRSVRGIY